MKNAVTKAYKKKIQRAMGLNDALMRLLSDVPIEYDAEISKQPPEYNVRLSGAVETVKQCLLAVDNALSEIYYDLGRGNYVEGEE